MFYAILKDELSCKNGFEGAKKLLKEKQKLQLYNQFDVFICAINVLKHGEGRSYEMLLSKFESLPFKIKMKGEFFLMRVTFPKLIH